MVGGRGQCPQKTLLMLLFRKLPGGWNNLHIFLYWPHQEFSTAGSLLLNLLTQNPWKAGQTDLHLLAEVLQISAYAALHALLEKRIVLYYLKSNKVKKMFLNLFWVYGRICSIIFHFIPLRWDLLHNKEPGDQQDPMTSKSLCPIVLGYREQWPATASEPSHPKHLKGWINSNLKEMRDFQTVMPVGGL